MQRSSAESERERRASVDQLGELNTQLTRLADLIGRESRDLSVLSETQEDLRALIRQIAQQPAQTAHFSEELRAELRLLSRTIAAALSGPKAD
jgi:chromosome segregation ATPase